MPSSISCRIFRTAPVNRNVWSTMIFRFLRSASSISSSACADVAVNGFSTKTCLPFSSALCQFEVRPDRRDDGNGIDLSRSENVVHISSSWNGGVSLGNSTQHVRTVVANHGHPGPVWTVKIANNVRTPITVPNYADVQHSSP